MALRKVAVMGNPILREVAAPVPLKEIASERIQTLIGDMVETMFEYDGRGLAAPQIHESLQVVVMLWDFDAGKEAYLKVLINPEIEFLTQKTSTYAEGCLSVPGLTGDVSRPNHIRVKAYNEKGEKTEFEAQGFAATVIQHECDHLIGKLYLDRMKDLKRLGFSKEYGRFLAQETTRNPRPEGD
ncbi:peptide deformylase [bacterium]|nr:peptide deformylase [bacterium]NBX81616.1 peptide deformylase [bacterium]